VVLVLLLFGLALIHELELAPGEVAVETAMIAVLVASLVGSVLAKKQNR